MVYLVVTLMLVSNALVALLTGLLTVRMERKNRMSFPTKRQFLLQDSIFFIRAVLNPNDHFDNLSVESQRAAKDLVIRYEKEVEGK